MYTALSDNGWKREDGKLAVEWEVPENIERAKASMEFMLKGCNAKADAQLVDALAKEVEGFVDPVVNA